MKAKLLCKLTLPFIILLRSSRYSLNQRLSVNIRYVLEDFILLNEKYIRAHSKLLLF